MIDQGLGFTERVFEYLKKAAVAEVPFEAIKMFELAVGVIAVYDTTDEWEAYFDRKRWKPTRPDFWVDSTVLYPPDLDGSDIGVLSGNCQLPAVGNIQRMRSFAIQELESPSSCLWHESPIEMPVVS